MRSENCIQCLSVPGGHCRFVLDGTACGFTNVPQSLPGQRLKQGQKSFRLSVVQLLTVPAYSSVYLQRGTLTLPLPFPQGFSVVTINSGVDVSYGRVTKAIEIIPSMARPAKISQIDGYTRVRSDSSRICCTEQRSKALLHVQASALSRRSVLVHLLLECKIGHRDRSNLATTVQIPIDLRGPDRPSWQNPPIATIVVKVRPALLPLLH